MMSTTAARFDRGRIAITRVVARSSRGSSSGAAPASAPSRWIDEQRGLQVALAELVDRLVRVDGAAGGLERDCELLAERLVRRDSDDPAARAPHARIVA